MSVDTVGKHLSKNTNISISTKIRIKQYLNINHGKQINNHWQSTKASIFMFSSASIKLCTIITINLRDSQQCNFIHYLYNESISCIKMSKYYNKFKAYFFKAYKLET